MTKEEMRAEANSLYTDTFNADTYYRGLLKGYEYGSNERETRVNKELGKSYFKVIEINKKLHKENAELKKQIEKMKKEVKK